MRSSGSSGTSLSFEIESAHLNFKSDSEGNHEPKVTKNDHLVKRHSHDYSSTRSSKGRCGIQPNKARQFMTKIAGGDKADPYGYPWQVSFYNTYNLQI